MIYIIGAGWYGCHIASELIKNNICTTHKLCIVDKNNKVFGGSSTYNQNRLHLGYHYPRSKDTIDECQKGFIEFKKTYPTLSSSIPNNLYFIALDSQTDEHAFSALFNHPGEIIDITKGTPFSNIYCVKQLMFDVKEEYIDNIAACNYFSNQLNPYLLNITDEIKSIKKFKELYKVHDSDWIINCTYNHLEPIAMDHYELYCLLVYYIPGPSFAITLMDGPYFSIYPYDIEKCLYTVTSVRHGVVWKGVCRDDAKWLPNCEENIRNTMETELNTYIPDFLTKATYSHYILSWKTKPITDNDDRSLRFAVRDNVISLYGGKITGIFEAARRVMEVIR